LEPYISSRTLDFHHGKHHRAYVDKVNELVAGTPLASAGLEEIVNASAKSGNTALFNAAAQAWNHDFQWKCLTPNGGAPKQAIGERIAADFGSYEKFADAFQKAAVGQFGSGWAWLVVDQGALRIVTTSNADTPIIRGQRPLFTLDVWEHAYYLDYQNRRADYVTGILNHIVNWDFVNKALQAA
jgi:Fe-Mn family superoxide dismutase